ncbi:MAG: peptidoglycan DD-metalloendopeptidase family protein [Actinobacteria bacterium]|nr:peptidoglycan DD-metalloendopeptidase family protein [Actinomycetota bacterium]
MRRWTILLVVSALLGQGLIQAAQGATSPTQRQTQIDQQKRDLQQKIKVADEQATALTRQIEASDARKADLDQQSGQLTARLRDAEQRLVTTESDLGLALTDLYSVESSLTTTLDKADVLRQQTSGRSRQIYEAGGIGMYAALLVGAGTFRDFVSRLGFVAKVLTADQDRIDGIEHLTTQLKDNRDQVIQRKTDITQKKTAIETERASISDLQQQVIDNRRAVVAEIATRQRLLSKVQADKASYLKQVAQLAAESRSIAALLRSRQRGQVFQAGIGKNLAWPTTGSVTSPFGWRIHPIFGDRRLHTGVDIGAPYGQAVVAAAAGTVISVSNQGGYGLSVVIDHGGALATLYAHLSATSVSVGQQVARGARVASVGCSGYCTGPHLHYETRVNGEPVDPMGFY